MPCDDCSRVDDCPPCVNEPDGSASSSPAECPPGIHSLFDPCPGDCAEPVEEPKGSASSSLDEPCRCGHPRRRHLEPPGAQCVACSGDEERSWRHDFVPAEPEAPTAAQEAAMDELTHLRQEMEATEPEACYCGCAPTAHADHNNGCETHGVHEFIRKSFAPDESLPEPEAHEHDWSDWGAVYHGGAKQWRNCPNCGATESRPAMVSSERFEPEAPECAHIGSRTTASGDGPQGPWHDFKCDECGASWRRRWNSETRDWDGEPEATPEAEPPRRPPYAVAYATEGGAQYEIALPGDATIRAHEGALIITHASAVLALTQARPMETE